MPDEKKTITISRERGAMVADCDLFATRDGRLVRGDDPEANSLVAREGMAIPDNLVESLGIELTKTGRVKEQDDEGEPVGSQAATEEKPARTDANEAGRDRAAEAKGDKVLSSGTLKKG